MLPYWHQRRISLRKARRTSSLGATEVKIDDVSFRRKAWQADDGDAADRSNETLRRAKPPGTTISASLRARLDGPGDSSTHGHWRSRSILCSVSAASKPKIPRPAAGSRTIVFVEGHAWTPSGRDSSRIDTGPVTAILVPASSR